MTPARIMIGPATREERDWCAALMAGSEPWITLGRDLDQCHARCGDPDYLLWVGRADQRPCGFILLHPRGLAGSPYIASVGVAEDFRGRGVGTLMVRRAEEYFSAVARHIFLCVSSFNPRAQRLYERLGYTRVGELPDYAIDGASEILMHKRLDRP